MRLVQIFYNGIRLSGYTSSMGFAAFSLMLPNRHFIHLMAVYNSLLGVAKCFTYHERVRPYGKPTGVNCGESAVSESISQGRVRGL